MVSQRLKKVSSLIQQIAASELARLPGAAHLTVTHVEVAPDLRQAKAWISVVAAGEEQADTIYKEATDARDIMQRALAAQLKTKFTPHLSLERDTSGAYADKISRLIKGL